MKFGISPLFLRSSVLRVIFCLLLTGCHVGPSYHAPTLPMPDSFVEPLPGTAATRPSTQPTSRPVDLARWWRSFDDPVLDRLTEAAIKDSFDLRLAVARLQEAREQEIAALGGFVPGVGNFANLNFGAGAGRGTGNKSVAGRVSPPLDAALNTTGKKEITHAFGFDAGWEIDLFDRYGSVTDALVADTQAAFEVRNEVLVSLVASVAREYVNLRTLQLRLQIARQYVATQQRTVDLVKTRLQREIGNRLDVSLAQRQLAAAQSRIAPLESAAAASERRIAVLLGRFPEALHDELEKPASLPAVPPGVAPGMPLELLRRRPDVRRAERQLAAATARVGIATADLFPKLILTASYGYQGQGLGQTPVLFKQIDSIGPSLYWPLLDFGRLDAARLAQNFRADQQLITYQRTVADAIREVNDAITEYNADQDQLQRLAEAVDASRTSVQLATERFNNGLTDFLNVLDAQRELFNLEDQYALAQQSVATQFITLYKSLGGGWEGYETPPPPSPRPAILAAGRALAERPGK